MIQQKMKFLDYYFLSLSDEKKHGSMKKISFIQLFVLYNSFIG